VVFRLKESERTATNAFLFVVCGMQVLFCECVLELLARWVLGEAGCSCWRFGCGVAV
jgi:NAD-dependent oxidoreductase involved in siderophore biosynthesis